MVIKKPSILNSEFVYIKPEGGYAVHADAPAEVKKEFEDFQKMVSIDKMDIM